MDKNGERYDHLVSRCPRLGHEVTFSYCRREALDLPCTRVVECWGSRFNVQAFLRESLGPALWERFLNRPPKDKMMTLLEMIEAARKRVRQQGGDP
ncbi:MAG TPA: hypothetical protein P5269_04565 [Syntrophales bacterium]|nr:hypothetical protein [Syntrophales bacterium]HRS86891.1 hypothetical protein [Syntrophales bacterium]